MFCFDKTGTLTKNGLDFIGVQGVVKHVDAAADGQPTIVFGAVQSPQSGVDMIDKLVVQGLATCHAVTRFGDQFVGNEVEVKNDHFFFSFHQDLERNDHVLFFLFIGILSFGS